MVDLNPGTGNAANGKWLNLAPAQTKLNTLFMDMVDHHGFSKLWVEVKLLKKGRKNVVLSSGKDFHFVIKPVGNGNPSD
ncbi:MAG: hypothetical protein WC980_00235 [Candidatus Brocadiia bacterium]